MVNTIRLKRVYDLPASDDGCRVLVDRLCHDPQRLVRDTATKEKGRGRALNPKVFQDQVVVVTGAGRGIGRVLWP